MSHNKFLIPLYVPFFMCIRLLQQLHNTRKEITSKKEYQDYFSCLEFKCFLDISKKENYMRLLHAMLFSYHASFDKSNCKISNFDQCG